MDVSGVNGNKYPNFHATAGITLYQLDLEIDNLQSNLQKIKDFTTTPQYQQMSKQLLQDCEAWVQQGNHSEQFPQFTSWVADAQVNGANMSASNPFFSILYPGSPEAGNPSAGLAAISAVLAGP